MAYRRGRNTHVVLTGKAYIKQQDFLKKKVLRGISKPTSWSRSMHNTSEFFRGLRHKEV